MTTLLIGGPADGKRLCIPLRMISFRVPEPAEGGGFTAHTYILERMEPGGFGVYRHEHLGTEDMIRCLILGYERQ